MQFGQDDTDAVRSVKSLVEFVQALRADNLHNNASWEPGSIEQYLERMAAWLIDASASGRFGLDELPPEAWSTVATVLAAGRIYE